MTTVDKTGASDAEFRARIAPFEAEVETVARALFWAEDAAGDWSYFSDEFKAPYRRLAAAAISAMPPSPAEHAIWQTSRDNYKAPGCPRCNGEGWTGPYDPRPGATCDDCNGTGVR